jgi:hypothetical protein
MNEDLGYNYMEELIKKYSNKIEEINSNPDKTVLKLVNYMYKKYARERKKPFAFPNAKMTHQYVNLLI